MSRVVLRWDPCVHEATELCCSNVVRPSLSMKSPPRYVRVRAASRSTACLLSAPTISNIASIPRLQRRRCIALIPSVRAVASRSIELANLQSILLLESTMDQVPPLPVPLVCAAGSLLCVHRCMWFNYHHGATLGVVAARHDAGGPSYNVGTGGTTLTCWAGTSYY